MSIGSSSSKRGLLRPAHSNRTSIFVVLTIILLTSLFIYNLYSSSSTRTDLQNIIDNLREKAQTCFKDKLEIEEKLETVSNVCKSKSSKMEEKVKDLQSNNKNAQSQLSNVRSESENLRTELDKVKTQLSSAQNSVSDQKRQWDALKLENQNLNIRIKELITQNKQLADSKQKLIIEISRIKEIGSHNQQNAKLVLLSNNETDMITNETYISNGQKGDWPMSSAFGDETNSSSFVNNNGNDTSAHLKSRLAVARQLTPSANALENRFLQAAIGFSKNDSLPDKANYSKNGPDKVDSLSIKKMNKNNTLSRAKDDLTVLLPANSDLINNSDTADQINAPLNQDRKKVVADAEGDNFIDNDKEGDLD